MTTIERFTGCDCKQVKSDLLQVIDQLTVEETKYKSQIPTGMVPVGILHMKEEENIIFVSELVEVWYIESRFKLN